MNAPRPDRNLAFTRREFLRRGAAAGTLVAAGLAFPGRAEPAGAFRFDPARDLIPAPNDPADWPRFRAELAAWRATTRQQLHYSDALYRRPDFATWIPRCFACGFLMLNDESFYDPRRGRYRVEEFLAEARRDFGGFDAVVWWHAYPRIGLDERNQFDCYRDQPGGLPGLRAISRQFRRHGVRVFLDYNPWDTGTRRESVDDLAALADLVGALEADGIFLDTMSQGAADFRARLDAVRPGVALEGEIALPVERIHDHHLSWAQWFTDSAVPGVLRNKWFERRHLQHQIRRWDRDHSGELHTAWMNGSGMMIWENVFGSWVGWNPRDRSLLRSMLPIQRRYAALFAGEAWTPLVPTLADGVFASLWEAPGLRLWTLVNRNERAVEGPLLRVPATGAESIHDLFHGTGAVVVRDAGEATLHGRLPPRGLGGFVAGTAATLGADFRKFMAAQARLHAGTSDDTTFPSRPTVSISPRSPTRARVIADAAMASIPAFRGPIEQTYRHRECGGYDASHDDFLTGRHPLHAPVTRRVDVDLAAFALDLTPVTNAQFHEFLRQSGYRPRHRENFLRHWRDGVPPAGREQHPVVYVDLDDARAYARWAGKRLPTELEWQWAAQGPDARRFPWGPEFDAARCNGGQTGGTTPVTAFPEGRSPFGCLDLCGNVWEWTESERSDGRTRFAWLKGGSFYRAKGSDWYFDGGPQANGFLAKLLLTWPGLDRCATVGFRCAADRTG